MSALGLAFRYARRELRSGLSGFRIFLASLTLGVAAIAGVGSLGQAYLTGLSEQGRTLLGGDVSLRRLYTPASAPERQFMDRYGQVSMNATLRSMAGAPAGGRTVIELKAVDSAYPMLGAVELAPAIKIADALACTPTCGAVVEDALLVRLKIGVGDTIRVGSSDYMIRARLVSEPDRITGGFTLGPHVMISDEGLQRSGLVTPGSLITYSYDVAFAGDATLDSFREALGLEQPRAGWRVNDRDNAVPDVERFVRQATMFLALVGLTVLVVGGVGAGQAIGAFIERRRASIATLKALGAEGSQIFLIYLMLVMLVAGIGLVLGLALGAAMPFVIEHYFGADIPAPAHYALYAGPLVLAAAFGVLTALGFAILPLARAREISTAGLFRDLVAPASAHGRWPYRLGALAALVAVAVLSVALSNYPYFNLSFLGGSAAVLLLLRGAGLGLKWLIGKIPYRSNQVLRLAFANLTRPGTQSVNVIVALGLGLTLLATVTLIESSVQAQVQDQLPDRAPSFFFVDIQQNEINAFTKMVAGTPTATDFNATPMLRGRVVKIRGVPIEDANINPNVRWIMNGDRGVTYAREKPKNVSIVEGPEWWPADYQGPELVSFDAELARQLGLKIGDMITVNVLGRDLDAQIYNLRDVDFRTGGINFFMIWSPGALAAAPHTFLATVRMQTAREEALFTAVSNGFPNITVIRVKEALAQVATMLQALATGVSTASLLTIFAGILVLAGAIAAGHRARLYEAVVLKVLGATRGRLAAVYAIEYGLLGTLAGIAALAAGTLAAWAVAYFVLDIPLVFDLNAVVVTIVCGTLATLVLGLLGGVAALSAKPAVRLRNP